MNVRKSNVYKAIRLTSSNNPTRIAKASKMTKGAKAAIKAIKAVTAEAFYKIIPKYIGDKCWFLLNSGLRKTVKEFYKKFQISII